MSGRWQGALLFGNAAQPVILDVAPFDSAYRAIVEIPAQLRIDSVGRLSLVDTMLVLTLGAHAERLTLRGTLRGDSATLQPAEQSGPVLRVKRVGAVPPPTVRIERLRITTTVGGRDALALIPTAAGRHPGVVLVHGSGTGSKEALLPFALNLARNGIAAVVYDKRAVARVGGDDLMSGEDLAADALAAMLGLATRSDIDSTRMGLWGISQGSGVVALAARRSPAVKFVVSISGGGTTYTPFVLYQTEIRLRRRGFPPDVVDQALSVISARHDFLRGIGDSASLARQFARAGQRVAATGIPFSVPDSAERASWERSGLLRGEAAAVWQGVRVPVLAIWGSADELVAAEASARNVASALGRQRSPESIVCVVNNADHGMQMPAGPGRGPDAGFAFAALAPAFRQGVAAWLRQRAGLERAEDASTVMARYGCVVR